MRIYIVRKFGIGARIVSMEQCHIRVGGGGHGIFQFTIGWHNRIWWTFYGLVVVHIDILFNESYVRNHA
jgi:hypothetical protein